MKKKLRKLYSFILCIAIIAISVTALPASALAATAVSFEEKIIFENEVFSSSEYSLMAENNEEIPESVSVTLRFDESFSCDHEDIDSDEELTAHRNELKNHYKALNEKIIAQLGLEDYDDMSYSWYGPFIEYNYATYDDFIANDYDTLEDKNSSAMECVYVRSNFEIENEANISSNIDSTNEDLWYPFLDALKDIGVLSYNETSLSALNNLQYNGTGIKIGILETGSPNNYINLPYINESNKNDYVYGADGDNHAFYTSSIIGGSSGIARGATLFFAVVNATTADEFAYSYFDCCNWLINKGVNIMNMSMRSPALPGRYDSWAAYADYLVQSSEVTFVKSAGNARDDIGSNERYYITSPGSGMNVITVAASDVELKIIACSSHLLQDNIENSFLKPTLTAPGGYIVNIPNIFVDPSNPPLWGTSYSAPMVTGIVALLMEQFPDLKFSPEKVMAVLAASCTPISGQIAIVDEDAGFGLINYARAQAAASVSNNFRMTSSAIAHGTVVGNTFVSVPANSSAVAVAVIMYNSNYDNNTITTVSIPNYTKIIIKITTYDGNNIYYGEIKGNYSFYEIQNNTSSTQYYTISAETCSAKVMGVEYGGIACYNSSN